MIYDLRKMIHCHDEADGLVSQVNKLRDALEAIKALAAHGLRSDWPKVHLEEIEKMAGEVLKEGK